VGHARLSGHLHQLTSTPLGVVEVAEETAQHSGKALREAAAHRGGISLLDVTADLLTGLEAAPHDGMLLPKAGADRWTKLIADCTCLGHAGARPLRLAKVVRDPRQVGEAEYRRVLAEKEGER
jgi:hypothetical protein